MDTHKPTIRPEKNRTRDASGRYAPEATTETATCPHCGILFYPYGERRQFCSLACRKAARSRYVDTAGYVVVKLPEHPHATTNGWVREHLVVACTMLGRRLEKHENVHHKDGNKQNNHPDNLEVLDRRLHTMVHQHNPDNQPYGTVNPAILCACGCGTLFLKYDKRGRPRRYIREHTGIAAANNSLDGSL